MNWITTSLKKKNAEFKIVYVAGTNIFCLQKLIHRSGRVCTHWACFNLKIAKLSWELYGGTGGAAAGSLCLEWEWKQENQAWLMTRWVGRLMSREAGCQWEPVIEGGCGPPQWILHALWQLYHSTGCSHGPVVIMVCSYRLESCTSLYQLVDTVEIWSQPATGYAHIMHILFKSIMYNSGISNEQLFDGKWIWQQDEHGLFPLKYLTYTKHKKDRHGDTFSSKSCFVMG